MEDKEYYWNSIKLEIQNNSFWQNMWQKKSYETFEFLKMKSTDFSDTDEGWKNKNLGNVSQIKGNFEHVLGNITKICANI